MFVAQLLRAPLVRHLACTAALLSSAAFTTACQNNAENCEETLTCGTGGAGGDAALGGAGGGDSRPPFVCDPAEESCETEGVIHVSPAGDDAAAGTADAPIATISRALELWKDGGRAIYLCSDGDAYEERLDLSEEHNGLAVYGGFSCDDFSSIDDKARLLAPSASGHRMEGATDITLGDLILEAPDAEGATAGASSSALLVSLSTAVLLRRTQLVAGVGAPGAAGFSSDAQFAEAGPEGNAGSDACTNLPINTGGAAVTSTCGGVLSASVGGKGGTAGSELGGTNGTDGDAGGPEQTMTGSAGSGETTMALCTDGGNGAAGAAGAHGAPGAGLGDLGDKGYRATQGGAGEPGQMGQGGGGGGGARKPTCDTGASGGSGGGGGCAGAAAGGGQSGGGSFGLLSFESEIVLLEVSASVSSGGAGGLGGDGQLGGAGGRAGEKGGAASGGGADACRGGDGGRGGNGGSGGGGAGGPSIGVAYVGAQPAGVLELSAPESGAPGAAGGLNNSEGAGARGVVAEMQEL